MFLVINRRSGSQYEHDLPVEEQSEWLAHAAFMDELVDDGFILLGGPLADEERVALVVEADSEDDVRTTLAQDPWNETHLELESLEQWTIRLDARHD